jgi:hypothetical protein
MMFMDEQAELRIADQRLEAARREVAAMRLYPGPGSRVGAWLDGALVRATRGATRRQEARRARAEATGRSQPGPAI